MTRQLAIILAAIVSFAVITAAVIVVIALNALNASTQEADYRACLEAKGIYETSSTSDMADMAESCYASVYGD